VKALWTLILAVIGTIGACQSDEGNQFYEGAKASSGLPLSKSQHDDLQRARESLRAQQDRLKKLQGPSSSTLVAKGPSEAPGQAEYAEWLDSLRAVTASLTVLASTLESAVRPGTEGVFELSPRGLRRSRIESRALLDQASRFLLAIDKLIPKLPVGAESRKLLDESVGVLEEVVSQLDVVVGIQKAVLKTAGKPG